MNIQEAALYLRASRPLRRPQWPETRIITIDNYGNIEVSQLHKYSTPFDHSHIDGQIKRWEWEPNIEDLLADDWQIFDSVTNGE